MLKQLELMILFVCFFFEKGIPRNYVTNGLKPPAGKHVDPIRCLSRTKETNVQLARDDLTVVMTMASGIVKIDVELSYGCFGRMGYIMVYPYILQLWPFNFIGAILINHEFWGSLFSDQTIFQG
jgi:hypothetical protein